MYLAVLLQLYTILWQQVSGGLGGTPDSVYAHAGASIAGADAQSDSCFICHGNGGLDISSQSSGLCYECHASIEIKSLKSHRHVDIIDDKYPLIGCEGCHRAHRAVSRPLLLKNELELCYSCHDETREYKSHPVVRSASQLGKEIIRGVDGRVITCASHCHDMHGTDYRYLCRLEPGRDLCISCHKDFK
jgi:predicted CXXCH cytochrome family protein